MEIGAVELGAVTWGPPTQLEADADKPIRTVPVDQFFGPELLVLWTGGESGTVDFLA